MDIEIRTAMVRNGETVQSLAEKLNLSRGQMHKKLTRKTRVWYHEAFTLKQILGLTEEQTRKFFLW